MKLDEIIETARKCGVEVKKKAGDPGTYILRKSGMEDIEIFEISGHVAMLIIGRNPAQISTETWKDILFPV